MSFIRAKGSVGTYYTPTEEHRTSFIRTVCAT